MYVCTTANFSITPSQIVGGVLYSIGAIVYATKFPDVLPDLVGFHGIWHIFVLVAAFCHFWFIYNFVIS